MAEPQYVDIDVNIKYTNSHYLEIADVLRALESAEKIIQRTRPFIEKSCQGYHIEGLQVFVEEAHSGSFLEKLKTRIIFGTEENKENAEDAAITFLENTNMKNALPIFIGALVGAGATLAHQSLLGGGEGNHIEAYNSQVINFGDEAGLSKEVLQALLDDTPNKPQLAREATAFISPAKSDSQASIEIGSAESPQLVVINDKVISQTPEKYEKPEPKEKTETYDNVIIQIIALDTQNPNNWHGEIKDIVEQRTKLVFAEEIEVKKLFSKTLKANVEITSKFIKSKRDYQPKEIYISEIIK